MNESSGANQGATPATPTPAGAGPGQPPAQRPSFLDAPPESSSGSPELRRLIFFAIAFVAIVTFLVVKLNQQKSSDAESAPAAVAPAESTEERQKRIATQFGGALSRMSDNVDFEVTQPYLQVVEEVNRVPPELFRERAKNWLDWSTAVSKPSIVRGEYFKVRGVAGRKIEVVKLRHPIGAVTDVYRIFIGEVDGSEPTVIDLVRRPDIVVEKFDAVDVDGVFIRTVSWEAAKAEKGEEQPRKIEAPYLIGVNISVVRPEGAGPPQMKAYVFLGVAILGALIAVVLLSRSKPVRPEERLRNPVIRRRGADMKDLYARQQWQSKITEARRDAGSPAVDGPRKDEPRKDEPSGG